MGPSGVPVGRTDGKTNGAPRWLVVLGWATGPAALYALLGLAHAALVERVLTVDVGFGRTLAYWVGSAYLALPLWAFLPPQPTHWFAHRRPTIIAVGIGLLGGAVSVGFAALWIVARWAPAVGVPVVLSLAVLLAGAVIVLRLAARDDRRAAESRRPD